MIVAIDGPAGVGKSTVAKLLASRLRFFYLDTGALYRAVAWGVLRHGIEPANAEAVAGLLPKLSLQMDVTNNEVTVSMVKATGNSVSVVGQVKAPGTFAYDTQLDVMQALSLAGGLTPFASKSKIKILRRDQAGTQTAILFDYSDVEDGEQLEKNILLRGGDVVVVPQAGLF